eukprot:scaffold2422_cov120-Isochrysis_galbana.AAC.1
MIDDSPLASFSSLVNSGGNWSVPQLGRLELTEVAVVARHAVAPCAFGLPTHIGQWLRRIVAFPRCTDNCLKDQISSLVVAQRSIQGPQTGHQSGWGSAVAAGVVTETGLAEAKISGSSGDSGVLVVEAGATTSSGGVVGGATSSSGGVISVVVVTDAVG